MEERKLKMNFFKSGSGSISAKANLPVTWLRKVGITPEDREFDCKIEESKDGKFRLIIEK